MKLFPAAAHSLRAAAFLSGPASLLIKSMRANPPGKGRPRRLLPGLYSQAPAGIVPGRCFWRRPLLPQRRRMPRAEIGRKKNRPPFGSRFI